MTESEHTKELLRLFRELNMRVKSIDSKLEYEVNYLDSKLDQKVNYIDINESDGCIDIKKLKKVIARKKLDEDNDHNKSEEDTDLNNSEEDTDLYNSEEDTELNNSKKDIEIVDSNLDCLKKDIEDGVEDICSGMQKYYIDDALNSLAYEFEEKPFNLENYNKKMKNVIDNIFINMVEEMRPRINKLYHKIEKKYLYEGPIKSLKPWWDDDDDLQHPFFGSAIIHWNLLF